MSAQNTRLRGLYVITDNGLTPGPRLATAVTAALRGGAHLVQYRDKSTDQARRAREARALLAVCRAHEIPFVVNDDVELAAQVGADGVHVGSEDAPLAEARVRLGPHAVIGVSCYGSLARALAAERAGADYVAFSSPYSSPTKPGAGTAPRTLLTEARAQLTIPICSIGGITPANGGELIKAGADMLAVISGVFAQADIEAAARRYARLFN
ncbi:MAG: thiamine phosphate synthase [Gammaproteobacteria bacterium]